MGKKEIIRIPHFLVIGVQKAGTTWLYQQLQKHPELYFPPYKELHYFGRISEFEKYSDRFSQHVWKKSFKKLFTKRPTDLVWKFKYVFGNYSDDWYRSLFAKSNGRVAGEITPKYSKLSVHRIKEIHQFNPDLKIICLFRNPVDRAWSHFRMHVRDQGLSYSSMTEQQVFDFIGSKNCIDRGNYSDILSRWQEVFPREQIFIGFLEEVVKQPEKLLSGILSHLNVDQDTSYFVSTMHRPSYVGQEIPLEEKYRSFLKKTYQKPNEKLFALLRNPIIKDWNR